MNLDLNLFCVAFLIDQAMEYVYTTLFRFAFRSINDSSPHILSQLRLLWKQPLVGHLFENLPTLSESEAIISSPDNSSKGNHNNLRLNLYIFVYPYLYVSIYPCVHTFMPLYLSVDSYVLMFLYLNMFICPCLCTIISICPSIYLSLCLYVTLCLVVASALQRATYLKKSLYIYAFVCLLLKTRIQDLSNVIMMNNFYKTTSK